MCVGIYTSQAANVRAYGACAAADCKAPTQKSGPKATFLKALAFIRVVALNIDPAAVRPADVEVQHLAEVAQLVVRVAAALIVGQQDRRERDALAVDYSLGIGLLIMAVAGNGACISVPFGL